MLRPLQRIDTRSEYHRSRYFLNARLWIGESLLVMGWLVRSFLTTLAAERATE